MERVRQRETENDRETEGECAHVNVFVFGPCVEGTTCLLCMVLCVCIYV